VGFFFCKLPWDLKNIHKLLKVKFHIDKKEKKKSKKTLKTTPKPG